jgi:putative membrane protein
MKILINWFVSGMAVFTAAYLLPGVHVDSFATALIVAIVLGVINAFVKPILFFLTLPITLVTLGLFSLILNAMMISLTDLLVSGLTIDSFWWALLFSILLSIITSFLNSLAKEE